MLISRDSAVWWFGMLGAVITAVTVNLDEFPWLSETTRQYLSLAAVIVAAVSGKFATSPLPGEKAVTIGKATAKLTDAKEQLAKAAETPPDDRPPLPER